MDVSLMFACWTCDAGGGQVPFNVVVVETVRHARTTIVEGRWHVASPIWGAAKGVELEGEREVAVIKQFDLTWSSVLAFASDDGGCDSSGKRVRDNGYGTYAWHALLDS